MRGTALGLAEVVQLVYGAELVIGRRGQGKKIRREGEGQHVKMKKKQRAFWCTTEF